MMNALKNTANTAMTKPAAQSSPTTQADSARTDVIAKSALSPEGELDKQARNLVGTTFFGTLLKQMRDSPFKSDLFSGGRGGQAFAGMYDQQLAQRMAQRSGEKLTRPIVKKFKAAAEEAYRRNENFKKEQTYVPHDRRA